MGTSLIFRELRLELSNVRVAKTPPRFAKLFQHNSRKNQTKLKNQLKKQLGVAQVKKNYHMVHDYNEIKPDKML